MKTIIVIYWFIYLLGRPMSIQLIGAESLTPSNRLGRGASGGGGGGGGGQRFNSGGGRGGQRRSNG